jgi:predicted Zn-dependent peptidase
MGIACGVGGDHESPQNRGISHFLEHAMFLGSDTNSKKDYWFKSSQLGTQLNAYTSSFYTMFHATTIKDNLKGTFELLSDLFLNANLPEDEVEKEKSVLVQEMGRYSDDPWYYMYNQIGGRGMAYPILGTEENVNGITRDELVQWRNQHYLKDNIAIVIVGDVEQYEISELIHEYWSEFTDVKYKKSPVVSDIFGGRGSTDYITREGIGEEYLIITHDSIPREHMLNYEQSFLNSLLGSCSSSRLGMRIREDLGYVYGIGSNINRNPNFNLQHIATSCAPEHMDAVIDETFKIIDTLKTETIDEDEFQRVKADKLTSLAIGMEDLDSVMSDLAKNAMWGDVSYVDTFVDGIKNVNRLHLTEVAKLMFANDPHIAIMKNK